MRVYLIGPRPDLHRIAYTAMAERLRADGHQVIDPSAYTAGPDMPQRDCRRADLEELISGEAVQLLPRWQSWAPSVLALEVAQYIGLPIWPVKLHDPGKGCPGARDDESVPCDCCRECQRPAGMDIEPEAVRVDGGYECGQRVFLDQAAGGTVFPAAVVAGKREGVGALADHAGSVGCYADPVHPTKLGATYPADGGAVCNSMSNRAGA